MGPDQGNDKAMIFFLLGTIITINIKSKLIRNITKLHRKVSLLEVQLQSTMETNNRASKN